MLFIEMRKKRVIKKAYEWIHKQFPDSNFVVYWEPHADGFFVKTNDKRLDRSEVFLDFAERMRFKLFHKSGFSVWIACNSINGKYEHAYNAGATETQEQEAQTVPAQS